VAALRSKIDNFKSIFILLSFLKGKRYQQKGNTVHSQLERIINKINFCVGFKVFTVVVMKRSSSGI
jgi:hypothetical protein